MSEPLTYRAWLVRERERMRLSQGALSRAAGLPPNYVNRIERQRVDMPLPPTRQKLHDVLGTTEAELVQLGIVDPEEYQRRELAIQEVQAVSNIEARGDHLREDAIAIIQHLEARKLGAAVQALQAIDEAREVGRIMLMEFPAL